jgi:hypothetical protein
MRIIFVFLLALQFFSTPVYADSWYNGTGGGWSGGGLTSILEDAVGGTFSGVSSLPDPAVYEDPIDKVSIVALKIIQIILYIAGLGAVTMIVIAGIRLVFSLGNDDIVEKSKLTVQHSVIGLAIVFMALILVQTVVQLLYGVD